MTFNLALHGWMVIKLIVGMFGVLFFLRISGKSQMSQMTPTDAVNSFVIGAIVGGIIYAPNLSVWDMLFAITVWTLINLAIHYLSKKQFFNRIFHGSVVFLVKDGELDVEAMEKCKIDMEQLTGKLREQNIYSLLDVQDVRLETDGQITAFEKKDVVLGFLLVSNGNILEENLKDAERDEKWLQGEMTKLGFADMTKLYCVEWTPERGFFVVDKDGASIDLAPKHEIKELKNDPTV
jgi:uncharacterized membrane protein YcaP (DUF421 family)